MMKPNPYYQLIPEKVMQVIEVVDGLLKPHIKGYSSDYLKEVISILACHIQKSKGTAPLKMEYIKKLVPQGDRYLKGLIDLGIILRSGYFIKGQSCYKYKFTPEYNSKYIWLLLDNPKLRRRNEYAQKVIRENGTPGFKGRLDQIKYIKKLTLDPGYKVLIHDNFDFNVNRHNSLIRSAVRILNGDIFYGVDNTSGRFHSNVTNMDKRLRPFLRINREPLVNIDIKNSQPYLSTILLTNPSKASKLAKNGAFAMMLQSLKTSQNQDVKDYIRFVVSGSLYEYLLQEFALAGLGLSRQETKQQVLRILFARNRMPKDEVNRMARLIFKRRFPTVYRIFAKIRGTSRGDKYASYKRLSLLLQSIESYLMLEVILKRVFRELPGTIVITIHDSIMTGVMTDNVEGVKKIMVEEMTEFIGFGPQISIERNISEGKEELKGESIERVISNQYPATTLVIAS